MRPIDADAIKYTARFTDYADGRMTSDAIVTKDEIDELPTINLVNHGKWILCSEQLPGKSGRYIVTRGLNACGALWNRVYIANYSDLMGLKSERIWWDGNVGKSDFERIDDVIAWMPLPMPYVLERRKE